MKLPLHRFRIPRCMLLVAATCPLVTSLFAGVTEQPNIVLILLDDAGYADFGFMGSGDMETPEIDKLASDGVVFTDFHVSATVCSPSRAGLITGRYQHRFGYEANIPPAGLGLDPAETTLAEALREEGYRTILIGKWHLGKEPAFHPNNHGFDDFYGFLEGGRSYFPSAELDQRGNPRAILRNRQQMDFKGYLTDVFTDEAIGYIRDSGDQPFFLFLSYNAVHTPMDAKEEHLEKYRDHPRTRLAAMTWSVDENIGRLRDELERLGIADNTLVFFFSDNGGAESNQSSNLPLKGWKGNKYEGGHRVPAIISWPARFAGGSRSDELVSSLDVFPTAVAAAVGDPSAMPSLDGLNLLPLLQNNTRGDPQRRLYWRKGDMAAMRDGDYKLVRLESFGYRMYNLAEDLGETVDLTDSEAGRFDAMLEAFAHWEGQMPMPLWYEDADWCEVTWQIHFDLMNNQPVRFKTPAEMDKFLKTAR